MAPFTTRRNREKAAQRALQKAILRGPQSADNETFEVIGEKVNDEENFCQYKAKLNGLETWIYEFEMTNAQREVLEAYRMETHDGYALKGEVDDILDFKETIRGLMTLVSFVNFPGPVGNQWMHSERVPKTKYMPLKRMHFNEGSGVKHMSKSQKRKHREDLKRSRAKKARLSAGQTLESANGAQELDGTDHGSSSASQLPTSSGSSSVSSGASSLDGTVDRHTGQEQTANVGGLPPPINLNAEELAGHVEALKKVLVPQKTQYGGSDAYLEALKSFIKAMDLFLTK